MAATSKNRDPLGSRRYAGEETSCYEDLQPQQQQHHHHDNHQHRHSRPVYEEAETPTCSRLLEERPARQPCWHEKQQQATTAHSTRRRRHSPPFHHHHHHHHSSRRRHRSHYHCCRCYNPFHDLRHLRD
ncbi:hypothetical protein VTK73DRAFT_4429 [Phialemonium thermophilum]|uniref:Uncharacterized protein n=1 Tax=Phialemonium thermophilum TaxID=223376 RepID=A0ABR3V9F6_9PEZI